MVMMSQSTDKQKISKSNNETEVVLTGRAVSRGVGIGKVLCLYGKKRQFYKVNLERRDVDREVRRFLAAVRLATRQLEKISQGGYASVGENQASISRADVCRKGFYTSIYMNPSRS